MYNTTRVENEVAIMSLVSSAMSHFFPKIVPEIYGWGSASHPGSQGWILQELMPGVPLSDEFGKMDLKQKEAVLAQIAEVLSRLQKVTLPETIKCFGGLTFDDEGKIVSAGMSSVQGGPWESYQESFREQFESALAQADANTFIRGWQANGLRKRLNSFVRKGLAAPFQGLLSKDVKVIVHGDFTTNNMLFDVESQRITALLDYDFSCISHPSLEFFRSMHDFGGQFQGWSGDEDNEQLSVREAMLRGFPSQLPQSSERGVDWEGMKAWEEAMEKHQVKRPRIIEGVEKVAEVDGLLQAVLPWHITNGDKLNLSSEEDTMRHRNEAEQQLVKILDNLGF
jgi:thiamine kinase-like enzyme